MPGRAGPATMAEFYLLKLPVGSEGLATAAASGKRGQARREDGKLHYCHGARCNRSRAADGTPGGALGKGAINCVVLTLAWTIIAAVTSVITTSPWANIAVAIFALECVGRQPLSAWEYPGAQEES